MVTRPVSNKYKFIVSLSALCFSPFYLIFKYSIFPNIPIWVYSGLVIIGLFLITFIEKSLKNNWLPISKIDFFMYIVLIYHLWLCFQAIVLGSSPVGIARQFWQYFIPLMVYFIMVSYLNIDRIKVLEKVICFLSFIVSFIFIAEWVTVHLLGAPSFQITQDMILNSNLAEVDYPRASFKNSIPLSLIYRLRIVGLLGAYNHNTSLFMIFGLVFLLFRTIFDKTNKVTLFMLITCIIAIILCLSRTTIIAFITSVFISFTMLNKKHKKNLIKVFTYCFSSLLMVLLSLGTVYWDLIKVFYFEKVFNLNNSHSTHASEGISSEAYEYFLFLLDKPIVFFTGTGLGYWTRSRDSISMIGADFGFITIHSLFGTFGFLLVFIPLLLLIKRTKMIMSSLNSNLFFQQISISCFTCILLGLISCLHYSPLFHHANYIIYFTIISILVYIDSKHTLKIK